MNKERIYALIDKYLNGTSTPKESEWLEKWLDMRSEQSDWAWKDENHQHEVQKEIFQNLENKLKNRQPIKVVERIRTYQRAIAALLILGLAVGFWLLVSDGKNEQPQTLARAVAPGTKAATLQMGDGEIIYLDEQDEGVLGQVDNIEISKQKDGVIQYHTSSTPPPVKVLQNTLFIPRGGQYKIKLADGTTVWLNSETTLIYPTRFVGKERKVKLIGEAYFEVAKNVNQPFVVESSGMEILVTGTAFNVSAYGGESETATTLIEGSVLVYGPDKQGMQLVSGEQAYQKNEKASIERRKVNVNHVVSWKKGYFSFDFMNLEAVMDEVSRWYDIDYEIVGKAKESEKLGGTFSKEKTLDELLTYLEQLIDVKIVKEGRKVRLMY